MILKTVCVIPATIRLWRIGQRFVRFKKIKQISRIKRYVQKQYRTAVTQNNVSGITARDNSIVFR